MTKADLIAVLHAQTKLSSRKCREAVETVFALITAALQQGEPVQISGFGCFRVRQQSTHIGRHPTTGQAIVLAPRTVVTFTPSQRLWGRVAGPRPLVQGRCVRCRKAFRWQRLLPPQQVRCPDCGRRLRGPVPPHTRWRWEELLWLS
jgi:integration host factor subunit alpha